MITPASPEEPLRIRQAGTWVLFWEGAVKRFARERPRAAALTAFAGLMALLLGVISISPGEVCFTGDLGGATLRVDGRAISGAKFTSWPAGRFVVTLSREGRADVVLTGEVAHLGRVVIAIPPAGPTETAPDLAPPPVVGKSAAPLTEEEISAEVNALEHATDDRLLATIPATERDAALARSAAIRAFARCRAAGHFDRSVLVFAPACAWARSHPGAFAADPWDAAASAADIAPPESAARAALCLAQLASALGRTSDSRTLFEKSATEARRQANDGDLEGAMAVTRDALALSPPDAARLKFESLLAQCLEASR